jgi:hypothetical protein
MNRRITAYIAAVLIGGVLTTSASAQKPITQKQVSKETATITAINKATRTITLKNTTGIVEELVAGPEIVRFDALKVGDKVTFTHTESVVYQIRKPGQAPAADAKTATGQTPEITRTPGSTPGGTITERQTKTVRVEAVDKKAARISVRASDGTGITAVVDDKKNLNNVKIGDRVDITYTEAVMIAVEPAK